MGLNLSNGLWTTTAVVQPLHSTLATALDGDDGSAVSALVALPPIRRQTVRTLTGSIFRSCPSPSRLYESKSTTPSCHSSGSAPVLAPSSTRPPSTSTIKAVSSTIGHTPPSS